MAQVRRIDEARRATHVARLSVDAKAGQRGQSQCTGPTEAACEAFWRCMLVWHGAATSGRKTGARSAGLSVRVVSDT